VERDGPRTRLQPLAITGKADARAGRNSRTTPTCFAPTTPRKTRVIVTLVHISDIGRAMHQNQQKRPPTAACVPSKGAPGGSAHSGVLLTPCLVAHIRDVDAGQRAVRLSRAITQGSGHCAQNGRGDAGEDGEPRPATDLRHHLVTRLDHPVAELLQGLGLQLPRAPKLVWNVTPRTTLWRPSKSCS